MVFGFILLVGAIANWQIVKAFLFNVCDLISAYVFFFFSHIFLLLLLLISRNHVLRNFVANVRADVRFLQENNLTSIYDALGLAQNDSSIASSINNTIAYLDQAHAECDTISTSAGMILIIYVSVRFLLFNSYIYGCIFFFVRVIPSINT
jgi:hypothetical protein